MTRLVNKKMWIIVLEGDPRAFPGMNASLAAMEAAGAKVTRGKWGAPLGAEGTAANLRKMIAQRNNIMYTVYDKGTTLSRGQENSGRSEHTETWKFAYLNEAVRDWLFRQQK